MISTGGIYKGGATMAAILPVAATAMAAKGATIATSQPVIWHFLGYPFEAAGMFAALFGCFAARFWIGAAQSVRQEHRWSLDIPVSGMALAVSAAIIISQRPEPLGALMYGAGLGVLGEGIFKLAEKYLQKAGQVFGIEADKQPK
jgi:hypothetical protein